MSVKTFEAIIKGKRPANATAEQARKLRADGLSIIQIAKLWGVSRIRVYQILNKK